MKTRFLVLLTCLGLVGGCATGSMPIAALNTQFDATGDQTLRIFNDGVLPRTVYARFALPADPTNRNNGFVQTLVPGSEIVYQLPAGTKIFACDGKYWDDYRPSEALVDVLSAGETFSIAASRFRP